MAENELTKLISEENIAELSRYTIPMILEGLESTKDKKGVTSKLTHAVINTTFYNGVVVHSDIYKRFLAYVTIETINAKFELKLDKTDYVILTNKKFQLPTGKDKFTPFLNACITHSVLDQNQNELDDEIEGNVKEISETIDSTSKEVEKMDRLHIFLCTKEDSVKVYVKFLQKIDYEHLHLSMNSDRIVIELGDTVLHDFHLSVPLKFEKAKAEFKNNCLKITSPAVL